MKKIKKIRIFLFIILTFLLLNIQTGCYKELDCFTESKSAFKASLTKSSILIGSVSAAEATSEISATSNSNTTSTSNVTSLESKIKANTSSYVECRAYCEKNYLDQYCYDVCNDVYSSNNNNTSETGTSIKVTKDIVVNGTTIKAGSVVHSDGSVTGSTNLPVGSVSYSTAKSAVKSNSSSGQPDYTTEGCEVGFEPIGGVCFPGSGLTGLSDMSIYEILTNLFLWLMGVFSIFAIIAFVISGIQYLTSTGDENRIEIAKRNAKYSLVGVLVGLSGFIIVKAISSALMGIGFF